MSKCPCCLLDFKGSGSICSNCGYQLNEEELKKITEDQTKKYYVIKVLTIISIISFIIWMINFGVVLLPSLIYFQSPIGNGDESAIMLIGFAALIYIAFLYNIVTSILKFFIPQLVFFLINIKNIKCLSNDINNNINDDNRIKKAKKFFKINLVIFIIVAVSFMTVITLFFTLGSAE